MRSVNTLDWHAGQFLSLKPVSRMASLLVRLFCIGRQMWLYTAQQLNKYLNNRQAARQAYHKLFQRQAGDSRNRSRHRHVPQRVWQRRSALLTMLEGQRQKAGVG